MPRVTVSVVDRLGHAARRADAEKRALVVDEGEILLDALTSRGVAVSTLCGGALSCRTCIVLVSGAAASTSRTGAKERAFLEEKARARGLDLSRARFSCQVRVFGDVDVEVPAPSPALDDEGELP